MEELRKFLIRHNAFDEYCDNVLRHDVNFTGITPISVISGTFLWDSRHGTSWSTMSSEWQTKLLRGLKSSLPIILPYKTAKDFIDALRDAKSKKRKLLDHLNSMGRSDGVSGDLQ